MYVLIVTKQYNGSTMIFYIVNPVDSKGVCYVQVWHNVLLVMKKIIGSTTLQDNANFVQIMFQVAYYVLILHFVLFVMSLTFG